MIDKRTMEFILTDQQEELQERADEMLCRRKEAVQVDLKSRQAQVVIGVRRSGKSTKCKMEELDLYYLNERYSECDFLVCKGNKVLQAVQVSYDISAEKTRKREVNGLLLAAKQTGCTNLLLLTDHESSTIEEGDYQIKVQPVYEWSLELGL